MAVGLLSAGRGAVVARDLPNGWQAQQGRGIVGMQVMPICAKHSMASPRWAVSPATLRHPSEEA